MMQADVQATLAPHVNVLVARPVTFDLSSVARKLVEAYGATGLTVEHLQRIKSERHKRKLKRLLDPVIAPMAAAFKASSPNELSQLMQLVQQLALVEFNLAQPAEGKTENGVGAWIFELSKLAKTDPAYLDRTLGVCPLPLYNLSEDEIATLDGSLPQEEVIQILSRLGVRQFFFPAPDHVALGLVDRGVNESNRVIESVTKSPQLGHPLGPPEVVPIESRFVETVDALQHMGYCVEGEMGLELTDSGRAQRATIRIQPREGVVSKLLNRLNISLSISDLIPPRS